MRTFIAVPLPEPVRNQLKAIQNALRKADADISWVKPDNIHLTLKFLGETDEQTAEKAIERLRQLAASASPFRATLAHLGAFPSPSSPRVIWVDIGLGDGRIRQLARSVEDDLAALGFPAEPRPFASHCTLGRTRSSRNRKALSDLLQQNALASLIPAQEFEIRSIVFYKSTLTPAGPVYTPLAEIPLAD